MLPYIFTELCGGGLAPIPPIADGANCPDEKIAERAWLAVSLPETTVEGNHKFITFPEFGEKHGILDLISKLPNTGTC